MRRPWPGDSVDPAQQPYLSAALSGAGVGQSTTILACHPRGAKRDRALTATGLLTSEERGASVYLQFRDAASCEAAMDDFPILSRVSVCHAVAQVKDGTSIDDLRHAISNVARPVSIFRAGTRRFVLAFLSPKERDRCCAIDTPGLAMNAIKVPTGGGSPEIGESCMNCYRTSHEVSPCTACQRPMCPRCRLTNAAGCMTCQGRPGVKRRQPGDKEKRAEQAQRNETLSQSPERERPKKRRAGEGGARYTTQQYPQSRSSQPAVVDSVNPGNCDKCEKGNVTRRCPKCKDFVCDYCWDVRSCQACALPKCRSCAVQLRLTDPRVQCIFCHKLCHDTEACHHGRCTKCAPEKRTRQREPRPTKPSKRGEKARAKAAPTKAALKSPRVMKEAVPVAQRKGKPAKAAASPGTGDIATDAPLLGQQAGTAVSSTAKTVPIAQDDSPPTAIGTPQIGETYAGLPDEAVLQMQLASSERAVHLGYVPNTAMEYEQLNQAFRILRPFLTKNFVLVNPIYFVFPEALIKFCREHPAQWYVSALALSSPPHYVTIAWRGPYEGPGATLMYAESLENDHHQLRNALAPLIGMFKRVHRLSGHKMTDPRFDGIAQVCGCAFLSNVYDLDRTDSLGPAINSAAVRPWDLVSDEALCERLRQLQDATPAPTQAVAQATCAPPINEKPFQRDKTARIVKNTAPPDSPDFRMGPSCLRRAPTSQEVLNRCHDATIRQLMNIKVLWIPPNETIRKGISPKQRSRHLYAISDAIDQLVKPQFDPSLTLPQALIWAMSAMERERRWKASTSILNQAHCLYGALKRLDQYTELPPIDLDTFSEWSDAMKTWTKAALQHLPSVTDATWPAVNRRIDELPQEEALVLLVAWLHAARVGNVYTVKLHEVKLTPDPSSTDGLRFAITWTRAKTVGKVEPYTTHSWISTKHCHLLRTWIQARERAGVQWLFPTKNRPRCTDRIRAELRKENPAWDLRSLRRGALCTMARDGVPLDTLITFSGHKNTPMLLRYLRYGLHAGDRAAKGAEAARKGFPAGTS